MKSLLLMEEEKDALGPQESVPLPALAGTWLRRNVRFVLLFVAGLLIGFAAKTAASSAITIGFQDYAVRPADDRTYDLDALQKELAEKGEPSVASPRAAGGGACGQ
jgi:hypothetical protein